MASYALFFRLFGKTLLVVAVLMLLPFFDALYRERSLAGSLHFLLPCAAAVAVAALSLRFSRSERRPMRVMEGAAFMVLIFPVLGLFGMLPLYLSGMADLPSSFFEAMATLSTTGLSCIGYRYGQDSALLLWHCLMCWLGGLIFVLVLVTVLPQVSGCFGLTLTAHRRMHFSPVWKKMQQTAIHGLCIYIFFTLVSAAAYRLAGLTTFEAMTWAMVSIASAGAYTTAFMTYDSIPLELASIFSMLLAGLNLLAFWRAVHARRLSEFFGEKEFRLFIGAFLAAGILVTLSLLRSGRFEATDAVRFGFFHAASFLTTTGFASAPIETFPSFAKLLLFLLAFVGGSIGAAGGGLKLMRVLVLFLLARLEIIRTLHPHMVFSITIDDRPVAPKIVGRILSFFYLYLMTLVFSALVITLSGQDFMPSLGLAAGVLTSAGSTADLFGSWNLAHAPLWLKLFLTFVMVLGRIEIFSFLILVDRLFRAVKRHW